jgi:hypothetical protein
MIDEYIRRQKTLIKELEHSFSNNAPKSTIVGMQQDYTHDDQFCLTSVVFIPDDLAHTITEKVIDPLRAIEPQHHFYPADSLHLTIKNIRTIHKPPLFTPSDIKKARRVFESIIPSFPAFDFSAEDVLAFPTSAAIMTYSDDSLQKLDLALDKELNAAGVPDSKTYLSDSIFWGNITVCRFVERPGEQFMAAPKKNAEPEYRDAPRRDHQSHHRQRRLFTGIKEGHRRMQTNQPLQLTQQIS